MTGDQYGHEGRHHGDGSPGCPRELHHHHDDRCEEPKYDNGGFIEPGWRTVTLSAGGVIMSSACLEALADDMRERLKLSS